MGIEPGKGIRTPGVAPDEAEGEVVIHDARALAPDEDFDHSLRPPTLEDFVNQAQVTEQLGVFIEAARRRGEARPRSPTSSPPS
jgi:holliday junction DNA helicase RuvB